MKHYLNQGEMCELSWLLADAIQKGFKTKKQLSKEQFKAEFTKGKVYEHERKKIIAWLDTFLLDSSRFEWKKMKIGSVNYRNAWEEILQGKPLSHKDSLALKKMPDCRMMRVNIESEKQAWTLEMLEVYVNNKWKFFERPRLRYRMKSDLMDTMFRAALRAYYRQKTMQNPMMLLMIEDSTSKEKAEICLDMKELERYVMYFTNDMKEIKPEEIFLKYKFRFTVNQRFFTEFKKRYGFEKENRPVGYYNRLHTSQQLAETSIDFCSYHDRKDQAEAAVWFIRRAVLVGCNRETRKTEALKILDLSFDE